MKATIVKENDKIGRKNFLKGIPGILAFFSVATHKSVSAQNLLRKKMVMIIDLQQCTGCGACSIACKIENNVPVGICWSDHVTETTGTFPNVRYVNFPVLCNHCDNAPCVQKCPTRAMYKDPKTNLTLHDPDRCIGCTACGIACPYGAISFNKETPHADWRMRKELIKECTSSGKETTEKSGGTVIPYYNKEREKTYPGIRPKGVVEKCTLCDHRLQEGKEPYCVEVCPSDARIVGDLNDPESSVTRLLRKYRPFRRKEHLGTGPNNYYIRGFNPGKTLLK